MPTTVNPHCVRLVREKAHLAAAIDPAGFLAKNDSYHFFEPLGDLLKTGPTNTNVMDVRLLLVGKGRG